MSKKDEPSLRAWYSYKIVLVPQKMPDAEDFLNDLALDGWRLIQYLPSGYGVFEKQS